VSILQKVLVAAGKMDYFLRKVASAERILYIGDNAVRGVPVVWTANL